MYTPPVTPPELGIPEGGGSQPATEAASEGRLSEGGEVVTRQVYRKVRLDHLLSKEKQTRKGSSIICFPETGEPEVWSRSLKTV